MPCLNDTVSQRLFHILPHVDIVYLTAEENRKYQLDDIYGESIGTINTKEKTVTRINIKKVAITEIHSIVESIISNKSPDIVATEEVLEKKLFEIISNVVLSDETNRYNLIMKKVTGLLRELKNEEEYRFYLDSNLVISREIRKFGNITIIPNEKKLLEHFKSYFPLKEEITGPFHDIMKKSLEEMKTASTIEVIVKASTPETAEVIGEEELNKHLNVLTLLEDINFFPRSIRFTMLYHDGTLTCSKGFEYGLPGPLDLEKHIEMNNNLFQRLDKLMSAETRTNIEDKVLEALFWFGDSMKEKSLENINLRLIICLESLLRVNKGCTGRDIAERAAFLYSDDKATRLIVNDLVQDAFRFRNDLVHDGKIKGTITQYFVKKFREYVRYLIIVMLMTHNFDDMNTLLDHVREKKFE